MISSLPLSSVFFSFLTLRLSMAKSKILLGNCHIVLENIWVIFKYLLILISNIIPQWWEQTVISIPLDHEIFASCCMSLDMFQCLLVYSLWKLEFVSCYCVKIVSILIMLNWFIVLFSSAIFFYVSIYSINFWEFDIETPTKNFYLLKKIIVIYSGTYVTLSFIF